MRGWGWVLVAAVLAAGTPSPAAGGVHGCRPTKRPPSPRLRQGTLSGLPLCFEENRSQTDPRVRFLARPRGYQAFFTDTETVFVLPRGTGRDLDPSWSSPPAAPVADVLRMRFEGVQPGSRPSGAGFLPGRSSYFIGNDAVKWLRDVQQYAGIRQEELWPGISLRWRGLPAGGIAYDLLVAPGADPGRIAFTLQGATSVALDSDGDLLVRTAGGVLRQSRPVFFQETVAGRCLVDGGFALGSEGRVGFRMGAYDRDRMLTIDPTLQYATYLGGNSTDEARGVAADSAGAAYVTGWTLSTNFPTSSAFKATLTGNFDVFVTKYSAAGALLHSTYIGGAGQDQPVGISVTSAGAAVVAGSTYSSDFPVQSGFQGGFGGVEDVFVLRLAPDGNALDFSTFLGGGAVDEARAMVVDGTGAIYVAGHSTSTNLPTKTSYLPSPGNLDDLFLAKFNPSGSGLVYSTYLNAYGNVNGLAVDKDGGAYLVGSTASYNFPRINAIQSFLAGNTEDAFVSKFNYLGTGFDYSTYLGGTGIDRATAVAVDPSGAVFVTGYTTSTNFPLASALQGSHGGGTNDAFLTKINPAGSAIVFSTYLGGNADDEAQAILVDPNGMAFVAGSTASSTGFPLQGSLQAGSGGGRDAFIAQFDPTGASIVFSSIFGGSGDDRFYGIAYDRAGVIHLVGSTDSTDFPLLTPAQGTKGTASDALVLSVLGPPVSPSSLKANLITTTTAQLDWQDNSSNETGFQIERAINGGAFTTLLTVPPGTISYNDTALSGTTTYAYRILSVNSNGVSVPSNTRSVLTPVTPISPPASPSGLLGTVVSSREVSLAWTDDNVDLDFFLVSRAVGGSLFSTLATPNLGVTSYRDKTVIPEETYSFKVRAVNNIGSSLDTNTVTLTMPSTLDVSVTKGALTDSTVFGKDSLKAQGTFAFGAEALATVFNPSVQAFTLRLGDLASPSLLSIPAADIGWKTDKKGKKTWKSPQGFPIKARIDIDPAAGTWKAAMSKLTLSAPSTNPIRISLAVDTDAGHSEVPWTVLKKPGKFKYP